MALLWYIVLADWEFAVCWLCNVPDVPDFQTVGGYHRRSTKPRSLVHRLCWLVFGTLMLFVENWINNIYYAVYRIVRIAKVHATQSPSHAVKDRGVLLIAVTVALSQRHQLALRDYGYGVTASHPHTEGWLGWIYLHNSIQYGPKKCPNFFC